MKLNKRYASSSRTLLLWLIYAFPWRLVLIAQSRMCVSQMLSDGWLNKRVPVVFHSLESLVSMEGDLA